MNTKLKNVHECDKIIREKLFFPRREGVVGRELLIFAPFNLVG